MHNFWPTYPSTVEGAVTTSEILATSYEGVHTISRRDGKWVTMKVGIGNQENPKGNRGASEVKSTIPRAAIATIEPWHGNQVVVYTPSAGSKLWNRHMIDDHLRWGHAVAFADLDGAPGDEMVIGVRDNPNPKAGDAFAEKSGVRVYLSTDGTGGAWARQLVDEGGVAVEDLTTADLDGDGRIDIIACGRATKNVRIYWNQGR